MSGRVGLVLLIALILGVFAYSAFVNIQGDEIPTSDRLVGR
jgi:hypothetical protein